MDVLCHGKASTTKLQFGEKDENYSCPCKKGRSVDLFKFTAWNCVFNGIFC